MPEHKIFAGKVVVIAGAGLALDAPSRRCLRQGARLRLISRDAEALDGLAEELRAGGVEQAATAPIDVIDVSAVAADRFARARTHPPLGQRRDADRVLDGQRHSAGRIPPRDGGH